MHCHLYFNPSLCFLEYIIRYTYHFPKKKKKIGTSYAFAVYEFRSQLLDHSMTKSELQIAS